MKREKKYIYRLCIVLLLCLVQATSIDVCAQSRPRAAAKRMHLDLKKDSADTALQREVSLNDSLAVADSLNAENKRKMLELTAAPDMQSTPAATDTLPVTLESKKFVPNPTKATWLALVIPGGGQIYNRKYWKLPIVYGGFAGCAYALTWNNKMYKDYMQAYKDFNSMGREASSVQDLLPPGYNISDTQLQELLRKRKDTYRRYRDLSIFAFIGVYLISVVDAYVDAELSNFDITPDLSMRVAPTVINGQEMTGNRKQSVGVQCSFRF